MDRGTDEERLSVGRRLLEGFLDKPILGLYVAVLLLLALGFLVASVLRFL